VPFKGHANGSELLKLTAFQLRTQKVDDEPPVKETLSDLLVLFISQLVTACHCLVGKKIIGVGFLPSKKKKKCE